MTPPSIPRLPARVLVAVFACSLLACTTPPTPVPKADDDMRGVQSLLDAAIRSAEEQKATTNAAQMSANLQAQKMNVTWEGEAAEILKRIADAQHLKFKVTGPQPRLHLPVFIRLRAVTLKEALEAIADQCGGRADIELSDDTVELRMRLY